MDLESDGMHYAKDVWFKEKESKSKYDWISIPNIENSEYYHVIAYNHKKGKMQSIPAHKVIHKIRKYKKYLKHMKSTTKDTCYKKHLKSVLKITKRHYRKQKRKAKLLKHEQKGEERAYKRDIRQKLLILGHRMRKKLNKANFLKTKSVRTDVCGYMMRDFGLHFLNTCERDVDLFSRVLGGIKIEDDFGSWEAVNLEVVCREPIVLTLKYDIKYTSRAGTVYYEKVPEDLHS
eukprot:376233_1